MWWVVLGAAGLAGLYGALISLPTRRATTALREDLAARRSPDLSVVDAVWFRSARVELLDGVIRELALDDRSQLAGPILERMAREDPLAAAGRAVGLLGSHPDPVRIEQIVMQGLELHPRQSWLRRDLALAVSELGRPLDALALIDAAPAREPDLELVRADILLELGRDDEALAAHDAVARHGEGHQQIHAMKLRAALEGAETGDAARRLAGTGVLEAGRWENHTAVGREQRDALEEPLVPFTPIEVTHRAYGAALAETEVRPGDPRSWTALGLEELRHGDPARATQMFRRATALDPTWFPAQLGLGASLKFAEQRTFEHVRALPEVGSVPIAALIADWSALTDVEQRLVAAVAAPLGRWMPHLAAAGVVLRILPLSARAVDGPPGEIPIAWVHELLDIDPVSGCGVARSLASVVVDHLPEDDQLQIVEAVERAERAPYRFVGADLEDLEGFFGTLVVTWLARRHGWPGWGGPLPAVPEPFARWFGEGGSGAGGR